MFYDSPPDLLDVQLFYVYLLDEDIAMQSMFYHQIYWTSRFSLCTKAGRPCFLFLKTVDVQVLQASNIHVWGPGRGCPVTSDLAKKIVTSHIHSCFLIDLAKRL